MYRKHQKQMTMFSRQSSWFGLVPTRFMLWLVALSFVLSSTFVLYTIIHNVHLSSSFEYDNNLLNDVSSSDNSGVHDEKKMLLEKVELVTADTRYSKLEKFDLLFVSETSTSTDQINLTVATEMTTTVISNDAQEQVQIEFKPRIETTTNETNKDDSILPILVIACNRISVKRSLDQLIAYRSSKELHPIIVSQDCGHNETREAIRSYGDQLQLIEHTNTSEINLPFKLKKFTGYYKIARHYSWALNYMFNKLSYDAVIIIEDDLDISPDLLDYFRALYPILKADETLYCISAWNDNGKKKFIDETKTELLYRTDFFPGLGWMLTNKTYQDFADRWPSTFWDDWMRHPNQRKNRACIRPEVPRTKTFGKIGVSNGQYYEDHLKYFSLNEQFVQFTNLNLTYLLKENYDRKFLQDVYSSKNITISELLSLHHQDKNVTMKPEILTDELKSSSNSPLRIDYNGIGNFKSIAKKLGLMPDIKAGVARTAYFGIVTIYFRNQRVYLAPLSDWNGYDENAS